ncbi:MAG TPA: PSD1 and planctomycete cytochrome C domain-containing protein, partial [Planctomycetaceae bacterium]|nr:PSD1 and planctomycete cytochrome C domain-containing protein [Planctomycetaceae bacterium]
FKDQVAPLLKQHCLKCHGGEKTRGEFDISTREGLIAGGPSGTAIVPFSAKDSLLYKLITHAEEPAMPDGQDKLPDEVIAKIGSWIDNGAPYEAPLIAGKKSPKEASVVTAEAKQWWSFRPLAKVEPPQVKNTAGLVTSVDRFIQAKAEPQGLSIAPAAEKRKLIRRAYLDLLGLPPTIEEVEKFVADASPDAWPRLIDRLLDSPHYGERWARHWLDVARFAESAGFEHDYDRPGAWVYRDFVIKALNADMPYDQFVRWQLAGDEVAPDNPLALSATGFLGAGVFPTQITANEVERTRYDALDDMLSTTGSAFLGLTIGCARCHDHKFDPIPTADYYRMLSTFTTTVRSNIDVDLDPARTQELRKSWEAEHAPLVADLKQYEAALDAAFSTWLAELPKNPITAPAWSILELSEIRSQAGATFKKLDDGSYLAEGTNGAQDVYTLTGVTGLHRLTGLKLEALAHPSMTKGGPGRAPNGNIGLSKITVTAAPKSGGTPVPVKLAKAEATFEQNNSTLSIASTLDDNPGTGWAVDPQFGKDHAAVYTFAEPVDFPEGTQFTVTLQFHLNGQHNIGRPRLAVIADVEPKLQTEALPGPVAEVLQKATSAEAVAKLNAAERGTLFDWWKRRDAGWRTRQAKIDEHFAKVPKNLTTILICGEGYKPMRHHTQGADFFNETYLLDRGSTDRKREVVAQSFLQVLMPEANAADRWRWSTPQGAQFSGRRNSLANWILDVDHGAGALASRVMVNRLWQHHFGTGLVTTPNDFGHTGAQPSHPELLDWLAGELIRNGWKLKPIHKLLMTSAVYQQATVPDAARVAGDPNNVLFVRRVPRRLEGEAIRDEMLAVSGKLDAMMYGPGTRDERSLRRSIYFTMKRSQLIGSMVVFDQPEPLVSQGSRPTTTVAPQALLILNGPQVREWARAFADRVRAENTNEASAQVTRAYRMAVGRNPTDDELRDATAFLAEQTASYAAQSQAEGPVLALTDFCQVLFGLNEFVYEE